MTHLFLVPDPDIELMFNSFEFDDEEGTIPCIKCYKGFSNRGSLHRHMKFCKNAEKQFKCSECDFSTNYKSSLQVHFQSKHLRPKDAKGEHVCPKCKRQYYHKHQMISHLRNECGVEPQQVCPFCPFRTKLKGNLKKHIARRHPYIW